MLGARIATSARNSLLVRCLHRPVTALAYQCKHQERTAMGINKEVLSDKPDKFKLRQGERLAERSPDLNNATRLIKVCARENRFEEGWSEFCKCRESGSIDAVLCGAALNLCAKTGRWDKGWQLWHEMEDPLKGVVAYSTMISLCASCKKVTIAEGLMDEMQAKGIQPNAITYISMIKAFSMASDPEKALRMFVAAQSVLQVADIRTRQAAHQVIMTVFMRAGDYGKTRELFIEMTAGGVPADSSHYTTLMSSCMSQGLGEIAEQIFQQMCSTGLSADVTHFTILISCHRKDLQKCKDIFAEMTRQGIKPSGLTYQELIKAHLLANDSRGAREVLDNSASLESWRNTHIFDKLVARIEAMNARMPE